MLNAQTELRVHRLDLTTDKRTSLKSTLGRGKQGMGTVVASLFALPLLPKLSRRCHPVRIASFWEQEEPLGSPVPGTRTRTRDTCLRLRFHNWQTTHGLSPVSPNPSSSSCANGIQMTVYLWVISVKCSNQLRVHRLDFRRTNGHRQSPCRVGGNRVWEQL